MKYSYRPGYLKTWQNLWGLLGTKDHVKVKIDRWDNWNLDYTLSHVILAGLKDIRDRKQGIFHVEACDVPEELHRLDHSDENNSGFVEEWCEWVFDEMIYAFTSIADPDCEMQFFAKNDKGEYVYDHARHDRAGEAAHVARVDNGLQLFGKYYLALWT